MFVKFLCCGVYVSYKWDLTEDDFFIKISFGRFSPDEDRRRMETSWEKADEGIEEIRWRGKHGGRQQWRTDSGWGDVK